jgi:peroxiredoxin
VWARRISYLIAPDGTIARAYKVSDTAGHAAEVIADLRTLQA